MANQAVLLNVPWLEVVIFFSSSPKLVISPLWQNITMKTNLRVYFGLQFQRARVYNGGENGAWWWEQEAGWSHFQSHRGSRES